MYLHNGMGDGPVETVTTDASSTSLSQLFSTFGFGSTDPVAAAQAYGAAHPGDPVPSNMQVASNAQAAAQYALSNQGLSSGVSPMVWLLIAAAGLFVYGVAKK